MDRRKFLTTTGAVAAGSLLVNPVSFGSVPTGKKLKVALMGTGIRGTSMWGKNLVNNYSDYLEFVGLCDINPGRLQYAKEFMGVSCPVFTDFEKMMKETKPDTVIVTTVDAYHHEYIIKALEMGANAITEKPMTTDEIKCKAILEAEKRTGKQVKVGFNYRYGTLFSKIKEILASGRIGKITSTDFHWYLNTSHGADYFRRWHGIREKSGTLLLHKSTHHFDLMNWFLDSDPLEVQAFGSLDFYGKNNEFRSAKCRGCEFKEKCKFYFDITKDERLMKLYCNNEQYDGYIRDNCLFRNEINIFDKMAVQVKYANNVQMSYSLTTYSPYEGWRIAFNGTKGRLDATEGIPWEYNEVISQEELHKREMDQNYKPSKETYDSIWVSENFGSREEIKVFASAGGHGGGDGKLLDKMFKDPSMADPYKHSAGTRDGAMSVLVGVAARTSIDTNKLVKIADLTDIKPMAVRP